MGSLVALQGQSVIQRCLVAYELMMGQEKTREQRAGAKDSGPGDTCRRRVSNLPHYHSEQLTLQRHADPMLISQNLMWSWLVSGAPRQAPWCAAPRPNGLEKPRIPASSGRPRILVKYRKKFVRAIKWFRSYRDLSKRDLGTKIRRRKVEVY